SAAGKNVGACQGRQPFLFEIDQVLQVGEDCGLLLFLDLHPLGVEIDVPALLSQIVESQQFVSHIDAPVQGAELRNLLVQLGGFRRSEEHTSELQSRGHIVCRLLLEKKKTATGCSS